LFQGFFYQGFVQLFTADSSSFANEEIGNDTVSSIQVIKPGALLKGGGSTTVYYYGSDGLIHPISNYKVYLTWYSDFSQIRVITQKEIGQLRQGRDIAYRPGIRLLKLPSDPKVFAVDDNRALRWIVDETTAAGIYGDNWVEYINDISVEEYEQYQGGSHITKAEEFDPVRAAQTRMTPYW